MALAGHEIAVYVVQQADGDVAPAAIATYVQVCGMDSLEFNEERVSLEKSDFKCSLDARSRFLGLFDGSGSLSGFFDPTDLGQIELAAALNGASDAVLWLAVAWDGVMANGNDHVKTVVTSRGRSVSVDGRVEVSYSLEFNGKVLAGPTT